MSALVGPFTFIAECRAHFPGRIAIDQVTKRTLRVTLEIPDHEWGKVLLELQKAVDALPRGSWRKISRRQGGGRPTVYQIILRHGIKTIGEHPDTWHIFATSIIRSLKQRFRRIIVNLEDLGFYSIVSVNQV